MRILFEIVFPVIGGLGIFLLGMKNMSDGMQAVAGDRMRKLIGFATNNRLLGVGTGLTVTGVIQSSSVATVMVVGMVNAGLMTLRQAIGVIFGTNIGTTATAWIMAYSLEHYGLPIVGFSGLFYLFAKSDRVRFFAMFVLGLGMVFFGLDLMKQGLTPIRSMPDFVGWFSRFQADSYWGVIKCVMVGAVVTATIQSSSATVGITMVLASTGIISYPTAAGLVLGENIGTTITAFLASLGTTRNAKRAAYAHMIFNTLGVMWIIPLFFIYTRGVVWFATAFLGCEMPDMAVYSGTAAIYPHVDKAIAATHSGFNILNMLIFLPWAGVFARFLTWLVPEKAAPETPRLTYLDIRMFDTPGIALEQTAKEIVRMGDRCREAMNTLRDALRDSSINRNRIETIFQTENDLDVIQKEVVEFLGAVIKGNLSHEIINESRNHIRMADEFESISDYVANLMKLRLKMRDNHLRLSPEAEREILEIHDRVTVFLEEILSGLEKDPDNPADYLSHAHTKNNAITRLIKEYRTHHLARVEVGKATPLKSLIYTDMLTSYRRIKDHILNITEVVAGEK